MGFTEDLKNWNYDLKCQETVRALNKNNFIGVYCENQAAALEYILAEAQTAVTIGFGGSMTITDIGVRERLAELGKELLNHNAPGLSMEEKLQVMRRQLTCDLFLASANAVTYTGNVISIDGNGNRVASMIFGPQKVILVVGRNKLVNTVDEGLKRIKSWCAPLAAKRLNYATPCAATGFCADCNSPQRICTITVVLERKPRLSDLRILVVNEDLGF